MRRKIIPLSELGKFGLDLSQIIKLPPVPVETTIKTDNSVFVTIALLGGTVFLGAVALSLAKK